MFSAIDGFRAGSSTVNVANGYISTFSSTTEFYSGIPTSTGSNISLVGKINSGSNNDVVFVKLNNNRGAKINLSKQLGNVSTSESARLASIDSGGNVYMVGSAAGNVFTDDAGLIAKFTSSGSLLWQRTYSGAAGGQNFTDVVVEDGGGNVYASGVVTLIIGSSYNGIDSIVKYNGNGNRLSQERVNYFTVGSTVYSPQIDDLAIDSGNNLYLTGSIPQSFDGNVSYIRSSVVEKRYANGTTIWANGFYDSNNARNIAFRESVVDSTGNIFTIGQSSVGNGENLLVKFYANGDINWQKGITNDIMGGIDSLTIDNTGNVYISGRGLDFANVLYASIDSTTGNMNWQNFIYSNTGNFNLADINYANGFIYGGGYFNTGSNGGIAVKLPSDGSGTGTHGVFTISTGNITTATTTYPTTNTVITDTSVSFGNNASNFTVSNAPVSRKVTPL
jgi:hypothetical protein